MTVNFTDSNVTELGNFCGGSEFWNLTQLIDNSWPEFTPCFRYTALVWGPCGWLWLASPVNIHYLCAHRLPERLPSSKRNISKIFVCLVLTLLAMLEAFVGRHESLDGAQVFPALYVSCAVKATTFVLAAVQTLLARRAGVTSSCVLFIFWCLTLCAHIIPFYTLFIQEVADDSFILFAIFIFSFTFITIQFALHCVSETRGDHLPAHPPPGQRPQCPEQTASFPSKLTFHWATGLIRRGYRSPLLPKDVWDLPSNFKTSAIFPDFTRRWTVELTKARKKCCVSDKQNGLPFGKAENGATETTNLLEMTPAGKITRRKVCRPPSLVGVLFRIFYPQMFFAHVMRLLADILQFANPILLRALIAYIEMTEHRIPWHGCVLVLGFFFVTFLYSLFYNQNSYRSYNIAMEIRTALVAAIYRKSLTMSNEVKKDFTTGSIVNLMAIDCQRILDVASNLWIVLSAPLQIGVAFYMLNDTLGVSFVAGVAVIVALIPVNARISVLARRAQVEQLRVKDERVKMMNEILSGIKVLKMYAWENSFEEKIKELREKEVKLLRTGAVLNMINSFCWICSPVLVTMATFITFVQINPDHVLPPSVAFVSLSLLNILRQPINLLPAFVSDIVQGHVSVCRIRDFLSGEDMHNSLDRSSSSDTGNAVEMKGATFTWDRAGVPVLKNINLHIPGGKLVAVVGAVGAGKSSLLAAMMGEMERVKGSVYLKGRVAYVPQEPWIQNRTFRDNVLFGSVMDDRWYRKVIRACALQPDIDLMPGGDLSEIGEKGVNVSGGQKQRLSMARAVYKSADVYFMDDPLSAVDTHVGKHLFKKVVGPGGLLKDKTRILVTHAVHWLPSVDYIVVMDRGHVTQSGSYEDLLSQDGPFAQFLMTYLLRADDEDWDDTEIQKIHYQMMEKVEYVTSDGLTSADEEEYFLRRKKTLKDRLESSLQRNPIIISGDEDDDDDETAAPGATLVTEEKAEEGKIKTYVLVDFLRAFGICSSLTVVLMLILYQGLAIVASIWLSVWTEDSLLQNRTLAGTREYTSRTYTYLAVYSVFGILQGVATLVFVAAISLGMVVASKKLHASMLSNIMRQPMNFFDTTPPGRVINRFSRDIDTVDAQMAKLVLVFVQQLFTVLSVLIVISYTTPIFIAAAAPVMVIYYLVQKLYVPTSRQLRRNESTSRSPIYAHFSETISGTMCIRAFGVCDRFAEESDKRVDDNNSYFYAFTSASRWLRVRLELLGNFIVLFSALFAVISDDMTSSLVGLSVSYALQVTSSLNMLVQNSTLLESNVISVERIVEYSKLPQEPAWINPDNRPGQEWPHHGDISFKGFSTRYREGLSLVLKGITCKIKGAQKIGIVGRTGAGKSSLSMALFRLIESAAGSITIDGVDISDIGLHDLRKGLTTLPQDPVLFSGTLRFNIDPFDNYSDQQIWATLEAAHLKEFVNSLRGGLDYNCGEGGRSLSVGQRQLVCLLRSLLRKTKVLIMDEATAAVDMETDELIQRTVRTAFNDCTVFTIAHRINTVLDYDKIIVLDAGEIIEFDTPANLLANPRSVFYGMAKEAKIVP